jgi:hypothetical protein
MKSPALSCGPPAVHEPAVAQVLVDFPHIVHVLCARSELEAPATAIRHLVLESPALERFE